MMRKKIHIFILFLFISSHLSAGKPNKENLLKPYKPNKDASGQEKSNSYPNNERIKRSLEMEDQSKRQKQKDSTDSSKLFKDYTKISQEDKARDRRGISAEKLSSYQEVSQAGQAKSFNHSFDIDRQQMDTESFWDNQGSSYTDDTDAMPTFGKDVGVIKTVEPFRSALERSKDSNRALPFWGNRGRQVNSLMGNSGQYRQMDEYPSWGSPERRTLYDSYWSKGSRRQEQSRKLRYLLNKGPLRKNMDSGTTFWKNRGRDSQMQHLFGPHFQTNRKASYAESNTMSNHDFHTDEPFYIIVERSSRSSGEEDPFVISRGKKNANELDWIPWRKAIRDRRGDIESIFKTVSTDPFFIARGKKYNEKNSDKLQNIRFQDIITVKELVCSTIDLMTPENSKPKREVKDRGEKNVLKILAAQLQNDPYYVSRGKKDALAKTEEESLLEFIDEMANLCN